MSTVYENYQTKLNNIKEMKLGKIKRINGVDEENWKKRNTRC